MSSIRNQVYGVCKYCCNTFFIINNAQEKGLIKKNSTICEATSGNSGIAFAMLAAERGYKMVIIMPSNMSEERKKMFKYYGATLIEVDEGDFDGAIELRDNLCNDNGWFNCNQWGKLKEMDSLEEQYKKILGEIKKRYNI